MPPGEQFHVYLYHIYMPINPLLITSYLWFRRYVLVGVLAGQTFKVVQALKYNCAVAVCAAGVPPPYGFPPFGVPPPGVPPYMMPPGMPAPPPGY
jgi:hypothetical protein